MKKIILKILGHSFLVLGIIGIFIPLLPTTPFLLLAAYLYSKSSPHLYNMISNHKYLGPPIQDWNNNSIIRPKAKFLAIFMISIVMIFKIPELKIPRYMFFTLEGILVYLILYLYTRPSK